MSRRRTFNTTEVLQMVFDRGASDEDFSDLDNSDNELNIPDETDFSESDASAQEFRNAEDKDELF